MRDTVWKKENKSSDCYIFVKKINYIYCGDIAYLAVKPMPDTRANKWKCFKVTYKHGCLAQYQE